MTKSAMREQYRAKRAALSIKERLQLNDLLLIRFQQYQLPAHATLLLSYWPLEQQGEVNTFIMADYLQFRMPGLQLAYPVTDVDSMQMSAMLVNDDSSFSINRYGIAEPTDGELIQPEQIDLVFVPLLVFDEAGHRIGYGKGFYDRFLPSCRPDILNLGFSYFDPVHAIPGITHFDVPLSAGITPAAIYEF